MLPAGVSSTWPRRPGEVPNTTLPPLQAWPTGVTSLDSPPRTLSTHTRASRVAIRASDSMPVKYLNGPTLVRKVVIRISPQGLFTRSRLLRPGGASRSSPCGRLEAAPGDHRQRCRRGEVLDQL